ncbi:L-threonine ammonia-lyase [Pelagirhabdus alkalitolerans]|uniref:L-threonine dehydratase n=1 Tax=Pelagirhabdus alkalitolerans TaxID=1612202 RepID=A0A1G6H700_9BACI|nr:threonine ammonia-lyase IlvA [Pelagirhabdus alkalitolerans]SDB90059.1 L-threonine ammonia-lyase [Pelagirhabdus alkalitolerans]
MANDQKKIDIKDIIIAHQNIKDIVSKTPLHKDTILSEKYQANVYLKREDLQDVRSFKIRGAYNFMQSLSKEELKNGVVCASAGNHAQGVAYSCRALKVKGKIFMPTTTPKQKVNRVAFFGGDYVDVVLTGDTFDDASDESKAYCQEHDMAFIHPFDDYRTVVGQGTIGLEILETMDEPISHIFMTIGGGGLISGVGSYVKSISPKTKIIGVEPAGAASMQASFESKQLTKLDYVDKFVDGASVKQVGTLTYEVGKQVIDGFATIPEGKICTTMLNLYNDNAIVAEPAGAMPISALDDYKEEIKGKNVVVVVSGGNNDIDRMQDIKERSLIYEGYKHYFIVSFPQRAGALREFLTSVLGEKDDITRFEYTKKNNRDRGPVLVGIELNEKDGYLPLIERMESHGFSYIEINKDQDLFQLLI